MTDTTAEGVETGVVDALRRARFRFRDEAHLQGLLDTYLTSAGFTVQREVVLTRQERIDLLVDPQVGIEVKTKGSSPQVAAQLARYDRTRQLTALILVTTKRQHNDIDPAWFATPLTVVVLPWT